VRPHAGRKICRERHEPIAPQRVEGRNVLEPHIGGRVVVALRCTDTGNELARRQQVRVRTHVVDDDRAVVHLVQPCSGERCRLTDQSDAQHRATMPETRGGDGGTWVHSQVVEPPQQQPDDKSTALTRAVAGVTGWLGSFPAILLAVGAVVTWVVGALFVHHRFANNTYALYLNSATASITFLMVFIIQNTQNREGRAVQAKLDAQSNVLHQIARHLEVDGDVDVDALARLVGVEDAPERVIKADQEAVRRSAPARDRPPADAPS